MFQFNFVFADVLEDAFALDPSGTEFNVASSGLTIDATNIEHYAAYFDAALVERIKQGMVSIPVIESTSFDLHPDYIKLSKAHSGKTTLGDKPGVINDYIAGRPFLEQPDINDPKAGDKLAWNLRYSYIGDNNEISHFYWQYRDMAKDRIDRQLSFYASNLRFKHRHIQAPLPDIRPNPAGIFNALYLQVLKPLDLKNTQVLIHRLEDDTKNERGWMYVSFLRKVRPMVTGQNTDSFLGSDIMIEDFMGYNGRIMDMKWTFKGTQWAMLPFYYHDQIQLSEKPVQPDGFKFVDFHGKGHCFPKVPWQLCKVYVLEAEPYREDHPVSKRVFYIDAQTHVGAYENIYDRAGKLWKIAIGGYSDPNHHHPDNKGSGVPIIDVATMIDVQAEHCTTLQFKTWVNRDGLRTNDFSVQALRTKGR